jgi:colicin import membrane protein
LRADLVRVQAKAEAADEAHQEQRASAAQEIHRIAELMTKAKADRDTARKEASAAREEAAKSSGQLQAMQHQVTELVRALGVRQAAAASGGSQPGQGIN